MNLTESGVSLEKIAALLGYVSLNAARIYTEPSLQDLQTAVEQLDVKRK
jgi:site-specific recombinase XerD